MRQPRVSWHVSSPVLTLPHVTLGQVAVEGTWDHDLVRLTRGLGPLRGQATSRPMAGVLPVAPRSPKMWLQVDGRQVPLQDWVGYVPALRPLASRSSTADLHLKLLGAPTHPLVTGVAGLDHVLGCTG